MEFFRDPGSEDIWKFWRWRLPSGYGGESDKGDGEGSASGEEDIFPKSIFHQPSLNHSPVKCEAVKGHEDDLIFSFWKIIRQILKTYK